MNDTRKVKPDEQFELLIERNRNLIDALKNLRRRLEWESSERPDEDAVVEEGEKTVKNEKRR